MPQDHAPEIAAFFRRLEDQFMQQWGTELPAPRHPALLPAAEAPVSAEAEAPTVDGAPTPAAAPEPQAIAGDSVPAPAEAQPAACEGPQPGSEAATAAAAAVPVVDSPSGGSASARDEQVDPNQPQDAIAKEAPPSCANAAAGKPEEDAAGDAQAAEAREMEPKNEKGS